MRLRYRATGALLLLLVLTAPPGGGATADDEPPWLVPGTEGTYIRDLLLHGRYGYGAVSDGILVLDFRLQGAQQESWTDQGAAINIQARQPLFDGLC